MKRSRFIRRGTPVRRVCEGGERGCANVVRSSFARMCERCEAIGRRRALEMIPDAEARALALAQHDATCAALEKSRAPRRSPRRDAPRARPASLPQSCPPPLHVPNPSRARATEAERAARASQAKAYPIDASRRELAYWAPWVQAWFRRGVQTQEQAGRELANLPPWWARKLSATAEPDGGLRTSAGRHVVMLGALVYWHARHGKRVISGLPQGAWVSLTVGTRGDKHYSASALFHLVHDLEGELHATARGPKGGRVGAGSNCGFLRQLERDGLIELVQPDGRECQLPQWLVGSSGWAFGQLIVHEPVNEPDDLPDRASTHERTLEELGPRILGPS